MKKLLLSFIMLFIGINVFGQASCAAAKTITANGTIKAPAITGAYSNPCLGGTLNDQDPMTALKAIWYKYTPSSNGEITISSDLPINDGGATYSGDTRLSVLSGTCTALTCIDYTDDVDPSDAVQNYLSTLTVPVEAGVTYYIEWDNNWSNKKFNFTFEFVAVSCIRPGYFDFYSAGDYTTTSAKLFWNPSIGTPENYDVDWSTDLSAAPGTGTIVAIPAGTSAYVEGAISGLPDSSNFRYYVRSNCGTTQSEFQGPYAGYLAKTLPYTSDFENEITDGFDGFIPYTTDATTNPASYADGGDGTALYTFNDTSTDSDIWGFSRAISLSAGETVTVKFKTRLWVDNSASPVVASPMALDLTVGIAPVDTEQTTVISSFSITDDTAFTEQTATWTATESGVFNFGFHNNSALGTDQTYLFFDTLEFTSSLSTNDYVSNKFSLSPNPTNDIISVSSQSDLINSISIKDLNGRIVMNKTFGKSSSIQMNIAELSTGMYLMNINTNIGIATKKIIKK